MRQAVTTEDLVERDIQIKCIWNVYSFLSTLDNFDSFDDFASDLRDGELNELLEIPDECSDDDAVFDFLHTLPSDLLVAKIYTPIKTGISWSWGVKTGRYIKGYSLKDIYEEAYDAFIED